MWRSTSVLLVLGVSLRITPVFAQQLSVPLRFEPNTGQTAARNVKYIARASTYTALLDETGLTMQRTSRPVRMRFAGASKPAIQPLDEINIQTNYYTGAPSEWRGGIRTVSTR